MKRIRYFDLLRCTCFCFIIFYHLLFQLYLSGICPVERLNPLFSNSNMHLATLGVAVFFMLSGASLSYTAKENFSLAKYYKKRFLEKYTDCYWIVTLNAYYHTMYINEVVKLSETLYLLFQSHSVHNIFPEGIPAWRIVFTFLGMDSWVSMHGISTFSLTIGEWFLGCLILLYLIFPLLRFFMIKNEKFFFIIATGIYLIVLFHYDFSVPIHMNFFLKGYEFVIGMMIGYYHEKFNPKWIFLSLPVVIFFVLCPFALPISTGLKITILAVAFWISAACLEPVLEKGNGRFLRTISNYSYEVFLVHHIIIYFITPRAIPYMRGMVGVLGLFLVELLLMAMLGFLLKFISDQCIAALSNLTAVENKR